MVTDPRAANTTLAGHECWELLRRARVGRLAVVADGRPGIFPVNFVVDHGTIVIRTGPGSKVTAALDPAGVAFECDGDEPDSGAAWSVVLTGRAEQLRSTDDLLRTVELPLFPWHAAPKPLFLRIVPDDVSGRRFTTVAPSRWARSTGS